MDVTLEDAYRIACQVIGEGVVTQRLLGEELARVTADNERLSEALAAASQPDQT